MSNPLVRFAARLAGVAGGLAVMAVAVAQPPADAGVKPANFTRSPDATTVVRAENSAPPVDGSAAFPMMLADAKTAYGKLRDYSCNIVRTERVAGKVMPEQTAELRVRTPMAAMNLKVTGPKAVAGEETSYIAANSTTKVRFRAAGLDGIRYGFQTMAKDDPKVLLNSRHTITDTGVLAVVDRIERVVATEKRLNNPVQVTLADYTFAGKPCSRYEVFADKAHANRYAQRCVLYVDKETKLPVRFEAYDAAKPGMSDGEVIEVVSFLSMRVNAGMGDTVFDR